MGVIASEAKQSLLYSGATINFCDCAAGDCFVAKLLAMTRANGASLRAKRSNLPLPGTIYRRYMYSRVIGSGLAPAFSDLHASSWYWIIQPMANP